MPRLEETRVGERQAQQRQLQIAEQGAGLSGRAHGAGQRLQQPRHQLQDVVLLVAKAHVGGIGKRWRLAGTGHVEATKQRTAQLRRAGGRAAGMAGDQAGALLQRGQRGAQFLFRGYQAGIVASRAGAPATDQRFAQQVQCAGRRGFARWRGGCWRYRGFQRQGRLLAHRCARHGKRAQARQEAFGEQVAIDDFIQPGQPWHQGAFQALQQQHVVLAGQVERGGGVAERGRHGLRPQRQPFAFQRWCRHQHGQAIAQFHQQRAVACLVARHQLIQRGGQFVLDRIEQAQRESRLLRGGWRGGADLRKRTVDAGHETLFENLPPLQQGLPRGQVALLIHVAARAVGLVVQAAVEIAQARAQRLVQPGGAEAAHFIHQSLCARRPARFFGGRHVFGEVDLQNDPGQRDRPSLCPMR